VVCSQNDSSSIEVVKSIFTINFVEIEICFDILYYSSQKIINIDVARLFFINELSFSRKKRSNLKLTIKICRFIKQ